MMLPTESLWAQLSPSSPQTIRTYLSGHGKDDPVMWDFLCTDGRKSGEWTQIGVPSCWEQQGFGSYNYGKDPMEHRAQEVGHYRHTFEVPKAWKNQEVRIVFEGVMTDAEVKINGRSAGEIHQGAFYEFKYSITDLLEFGAENLLEVTVHKVSANESINFAEREADFWVFGGIYRPVYLETAPKDHIERVAIDAQASGEVMADLFLQGSKAETVRASLLDLQGNLVQKLEVELAKSSEKWTIQAQAQNIQTWNPERPKLYQLVIQLVDKKGRDLHTYTSRMGFRTVEVREGDGIYVNGVRIKFKGVNRHSFYPSSGRTTSKALSIEHAQMIKDMNMNAVRMSHYPPDVHFLDVCDSLGLFVIDEVCTWHSPHLDTEVGRKIVRETVTRDVNHPSILLWANGNETGWNTELDDDYAIWDIQQREVIHPWNIFRKTNTLHYMYFHGLYNDTEAQDRVLFPTEFLHGLYDGGHGAGLEDYWQVMWDHPLCAGGFLWDFADEGVVRTDWNDSLDTDGNHGADGIVGPYGEKEASYFTIKEIWSPLFIEKRIIRDGFNGIFRLENRYHYTSLDQCRMTAKWVKFPGPLGHSEATVIQEQAVHLPAIAPGMKGQIAVDKPSNWHTADALHLTAFDPDGQEIFTWTYPVQLPESVNEPLTEHTFKGPFEITRNEQEIHIQAANTLLAFSAKNGQLMGAKSKGTAIPLENGPVLLGQHAPIDTILVEQRPDRVILTAMFELKRRNQEWVKIAKYSADFIRWTIYPDGMVDLEVEMKNKKKVTGFKGITFSFPEAEVQGMKWLGDGPYRVWRNRMKGTQFQVWENDYNNTVTGESGFVYPEFKGFFSNLYWARIKGRHGNGFTVYCHTPYTYFRMLTPQNPSHDDRKRVSPEFPEGDISFLKNIPAIGNKFQTLDLLGPRSNPENFFGNSDEPLRFKLTFDFRPSTDAQVE
ncbi:glycoside hydrolase family 2 TIM barrel-domain containing protein [Pontibacter sp. G13]|uniref:glycoside hydrolase family 2 protein n=1 Tax=Pontibacter sp. G13 TaxID=3074898 RepID=UPI00288C0785|nr:glycoside hydrolase family 2 TIM barrel-domain containing protein [Pontibacter sp. G13]WNJ17954.1 glycoside hydrolase family 2 TIM barrel-domain containing protein [Pontibacter sp. G13]